MHSRWCRISEPSTVLLRQMVRITQNQALFFLKKNPNSLQLKSKENWHKNMMDLKQLAQVFEMTWWFQIYQPWFHFSTFSHSKKNKLPHWRASCGTSCTWWCHLVIAATLLGTWRYHDRLMKQISSIAFYGDLRPSNKTNISYLGKKSLDSKVPFGG